MENDIERQDRIDKYLLGKMSASKKQAFESTLISDAALRESVDLQRKIIEEVNQRATFEKMVEETGSRVIPLYWKVISIAAVFTGLFIVTFWQPWNMSNQKIVNTYLVALPIIIPEGQIQNETLIRGDECEFENLTSEECDSIKNALFLYKSENYVEACSIFESILTPIQKNYELAIYLAISQMKTGNYKKGLLNLETLSKLPNYSFHDKADFYLALAYIQNGELSKAREILYQIKDKRIADSTQIRGILKNMRWF